MQQVYAAHNRSPQEVQRASSGGVFAALAQQTLQQGGIVYGAAMEHGTVCCRGITTEEELPLLFGSKYVFVPLTPVLEEIAACAAAGRPVMVVTSPCQAAALRRRCGTCESLTVVDFVCHGAPEPAFLQKYLTECTQEHKSPVETVDFRKKAPNQSWAEYDVELRYANGDTESMRAADNPYMRLFLCNASLRRACGVCTWKGEHRASDITLGDFWGISKLEPAQHHAEGTSLVFVNTQRGAACWSVVQEQLVSCAVDAEAAVQYNPSAVRAACLPAQYEQFQRDCETQTVAQLAAQYARKSMVQKAKELVKRVRSRL